MIIERNIERPLLNTEVGDESVHEILDLSEISAPAKPRNDLDRLQCLGL